MIQTKYDKSQADGAFSAHMSREHHLNKYRNQQNE